MFLKMYIFLTKILGLFGMAGETFIHESVIGSKFYCQLVSEGPPIIGFGKDEVKSRVPTDKCV